MGLLSGLSQRRRFQLVAAAGLLALIAVAATKPALRTLGSWIAAPDAARRSEFVILTPEVGEGGDLEAASLFEEGMVAAVAVLEPARGRIEREFERRGVILPNARVERLVLLGIPRDRLTMIPAGEGGTTDSVKALSAWLTQHPSTDAVILTSLTHTRRFRRALARQWSGERRLPAVHAPRLDSFRSDTWWQQRRTLREGIVELQKLTLDYLTHPF